MFTAVPWGSSGQNLGTSDTNHGSGILAESPSVHIAQVREWQACLSHTSVKTYFKKRCCVASVGFSSHVITSLLESSADSSSHCES